MKIKILLILVFFTACKKNIKYLDLEQVNYEYISNVSTCAKAFEQTRLLDETISDFLTSKEVKASKNLRRLRLMFLLKSGQIEHLTKMVAIYSDNDKLITKVNRREVEIKELNYHIINNLFDPSNSIFEEEEINETQLLLIDILPNEVNCYFKSNVNPQIVEEINSICY
ncbi:hypothetical protein [Cellulophaga omnivescoria]|uniref:hypothetical protein n=1 Tax=Cellulophaga omnivescoria TaxID=1888890 RepID=UPI0022F0C16F|nr:hypothetical protein [Cellulophaga omnivescoria]WBU89381.1 hypothetical protein PBN93_16100 [Cellulophaga omnivescoria]